MPFFYPYTPRASGPDSSVRGDPADSDRIYIFLWARRSQIVPSIERRESPLVRLANVIT